MTKLKLLFCFFIIVILGGCSSHNDTPIQNVFFGEKPCVTNLKTFNGLNLECLDSTLFHDDFSSSDKQWTPIAGWGSGVGGGVNGLFTLPNTQNNWKVAAPSDWESFVGSGNALIPDSLDFSKYEFTFSGIFEYDNLNDELCSGIVFMIGYNPIYRKLGLKGNNIYWGIYQDDKFIGRIKHISPVLASSNNKYTIRHWDSECYLFVNDEFVCDLDEGQPENSPNTFNYIGYRNDASFGIIVSPHSKVIIDEIDYKILSLH